MKKFITCLLCSAALLLANGCGDESEIFYSISYPVVRIEAEVTIPQDEEPATGDDSGTDSGSDSTAPDETEEPDGTGSDSTEPDGTEEPADPLVAQIQAEAEAEALVQAGGCYTLDFARYNRGYLTIETATQSGTLTGVFFKEPGASELTFFYLDTNTSCTLSYYTDTDGVRKVLLLFDRTEAFQARYPDAGLTKVIRREYTSTPTI